MSIMDRVCVFLRSLIRANRLPAYFAFAVLGLWIGTIVSYMYEQEAPIAYNGGDKVMPAAAHPGDLIWVYRNYTIRRDGFIRVNRQMINGDCTKKCDKINLPSSEIFAKTGTYNSNGVSHVIPFPAKPGKYALQFVVRWEDRFGRERYVQMPELTVEVLP